MVVVVDGEGGGEREVGGGEKGKRFEGEEMVDECCEWDGSYSFFRLQGP